MENLPEKCLYFIYCRNKEKNNIGKIEENNVVTKIKNIEEKKYQKYTYILYCLELSNENKEKPFTLTLINKEGDLFYKDIYPKNPGEFKYDMIFNSFENLENNSLGQVTLSYKEQFIIFKNYLKDEKKLNNLLLDSINYFSEINNPDINYNFILLLFIETYKIYKNNPNILIKNTIIKYFEDLNFQLFGNKENNQNIIKDVNLKPFLDINPKDLDILSDVDNIRNELISITGNKEEINIKIDSFLCFYYIYFRPNLFVRYIEIKKKDFNEIKSHLLFHKKIFNNFNSDILNNGLMEETENLEQIETILKNFIPDMKELFKILSDEIFYMKLSNLSLIEQKLLKVFDICEPKKEDCIREISNYFDIIIDLFIKERNLPIYFGKEFYLEYCKLFLNENFENIELIHGMLKSYNIHVTDKYKIKIDNEINNYYHDTGIHLIINKKLLNNDVFEFLKNDPYFNNKENRIPIDLIYKGIVFDENDKKFINEFLNDRLDNFDLKSFFGFYYSDFLKNIFSTFEKPKDLVCLRNWDISYDVNDEVITNFLYAVKRIWLGDPKNHMYALEKLIGNAFGKASLKMGNYKEDIISELEAKISSDLLLPIYSEILYRDYATSPYFRQHIIDFINNHNNKKATYIWYKLNTLDDDEGLKNDFLENNLKEEYAVQAKDFVSYPASTDDKITLFTLLYNAKYFRNNSLRELPYYNKSIDSKDEINNLKYNEVMKMYKNIMYFQTLFLFFVPGPYRDENIFIIDSILINFSEKCEKVKAFYDLLKSIKFFWENFFSTDEEKKLNELNKLISEYEETSLKNCEKMKDSYPSYLKLKEKANEAEKLIGSIFFMSIYDSNKGIYNNDTDRYNNTYKQFNELKKIGKDYTLNSLENKLKDILVRAIYKKRDELPDELKFINSFFNFNWNEYNISKIKNNFLKLVLNYQKENGLDEFVEINEEEEEKNIIIDKEEKKDKDNIYMSINVIKEEKKKLMDEINKLENNYFLKSKIIKNIHTEHNNNDNILNELNNNFIDYFMKIFETNYGFAKIDIEELKNKVISISNKIYINAVGLGLTKKKEKQKILISEYYDIYKAITQQNKQNKNEIMPKNVFLLLKYIEELYENRDENVDKIKECIDNLFDLVKEKVKKEKINDLLNKLLIKEKSKNNSIPNIDKYFEIIFRKESNNFCYICDNILPIPFIDSVLYDNINQNKIDFKARYINKINDICNEKKIFEEMFLFYFESKIMMLFNIRFNNERELFSSEMNNLITCINELNNDIKNRTRNILQRLYNIAFIKCYYNKLINYLFNHNQNTINDLDKIFIISLNRITERQLRISLKMYILKIFFDNIGNLFLFKTFNFTLYQIEYTTSDNDIKEVMSKNALEFESKDCGFDYLFLPIKQDENLDFTINENNYKDYENLLKYLSDIKNEKKDIPDLIENINNNNIDYLYCGLVNFHFSNYYKKLFFNEPKYSILNKWINDRITNKEFEILKNNDIISNILLIFIDQNSYNKILGNSIELSHNELLCILISARYVLNTISSNKKEGLFYKLIMEPQKTISNYKDYFKYYLKDYDTFFRWKFEIKYLTYKMINYIILSHLYFGFLLGNIDKLDDIYKLLSLVPNNKDNKNNNLLSLLFEEFDFINKNILNLMGIKKIIIFMNYIFEHVSNIIININCDINDSYIKDIESQIDNAIFDKLTRFDFCVKDYFNKIHSYSLDKIGIDKELEKKELIYKDILLENDEFYNNKDTSKKYPYITYLTSTNFCSFDDFKNQYLYIEYDENKNYPMIDCIIKNNNIIELVDLLPKLNSFINDIYNKLLLKISESDLNKNIESFRLDLNINEFNNLLQMVIKKLNCGDDIKINITQDSKVSDIINIKDNIIYKIYNKTIKIYNGFLSKTKIYIDNKDKIESVIIQSATNNDFVTFKSVNYNANIINNISAKERLYEIINIYSKRNRIQDEKINVYDGGRIIYDYNIIENILEEEFVFGKKPFSEVQKTFIFSNNVFSNERSNLLIDFITKYKQIGIESNILVNIDSNLREGNNDNINKNIINYYYNLQYIIIYIMTYEKDNKYINDETSIDYIIKIIEKENYKMDEQFKLFIEYSPGAIKINNLISLYEKIELDSFEYLIKEMTYTINENDFQISDDQKNNISKILNDNTYLSHDNLINGIERYILRYCYGDNNILDKINQNFSNIFNRIDLWENYSDKDFIKEYKNLLSINEKENCIIKYCFHSIFQKQIKENSQLNDNNNIIINNLDEIQKLNNNKIDEDELLDED